ncbi:MULTISPECIES: bifunctional folylpolyglutamate synthase/dihydrofolate synthase [Virgibacillus]|uniref:tetrahydrofolate synthase n=1 Tax=Virgibacillus dokdonensis TaxID=302167 RepID=A0ABU7VGC0_9BACI|nr:MULTISPECIES: folylpolyglutamate synthase/dihydrofolate synthase family protein [Virgibacillus]NWO13687.1 bifunctional folylpolyglutamate synthase/dihydrofolate synthase [Virgibacillus sp.]
MKQIEAFFNHRHQLGVKPGLERMQQLLALLGHPEKRLNAVHIAGTNGKGSTAAFVKQGLQASGYQVGVFTSPSLHGIRGYIYVEEEPISEQAFLKVWEKVYPAVQELDQKNQSPTEFEILTAIAFFYFVTNVDIAVIEAGMGGREDTTNCIIPLVSIITSVSKDHMAFLGQTIPEIALHKAGIIKQGVPVVIGQLQLAAKEVIIQEAEAKEAPVYQLGLHFHYQSLPSKEWNHMEWNLPYTKGAAFKLKLYGEHQLANASLALMALHLIQQKGCIIQLSKLPTAFFDVQLEGRFELVSQHPIIILDGAHNPAGIRAFIDTLEKVFPYQERQLLFAAFKDKAIDEMMIPLTGKFSEIYLTTFDHPRAASISEMKKISLPSMKTINSWENAISKMSDPNTVYCITGSLHFISIVRSYLLSKNK